MRSTTRRTRRSGIWALAIPVAVASGAYAFTASNTVGATQAGDGSGAITGFVLSSVKYNLNATNPSNIDSVTFTLDATPASGSTLKAQLAAAGSWYTCTNVTTAVTCPVTSPQATGAAATTLRVVIAQ
ncbi:MAG: hypothetical protein ABIY48_00435 [Acidimicrobiales bacterium]